MTLPSPHGPLRVGIGGPVGSGKTALAEALCKSLRDRHDLFVITNDIYTKEDQRILTEAGALPAERIEGVETGGCPHTAIREDASINLSAIADMCSRFPSAELCLIESGGRQSRRHLQPGAGRHHHLCDRRGGRREDSAQGRAGHHALRPPGHQQDRSCSAGRRHLDVMRSDTDRMRGGRPWVFTNLKTGEGLSEVVGFITSAGGLGASPKIS